MHTSTLARGTALQRLQEMKDLERKFLIIIHGMKSQCY